MAPLTIIWCCPLPLLLTWKVGNLKVVSRSSLCCRSFKKYPVGMPLRIPIGNLPIFLLVPLKFQYLAIGGFLSCFTRYSGFIKMNSKPSQSFPIRIHWTLDRKNHSNWKVKFFCMAKFSSSWQMNSFNSNHGRLKQFKFLIMNLIYV